MTPRQRILIVAEDVATKHGYTLSDILNPTRLDRIVRVRDEAIYEIWRANSLSFSQIGRIFKREHTSVYMSLCRHMHRSGIEHRYAETYRKKIANQLVINRRAQVLNVAA